tara:strand:- start:59 stop:160 length:102 start_codon:yes stop_codon:yes gene_type:complete
MASADISALCWLVNGAMVSSVNSVFQQLIIERD